MKIVSYVAVAFIIFTCASQALAGFDIDGNLDDWGVDVKTGPTTGSMTDFSGVSSKSSVLYKHIEDTRDNAGHSVYLGPQAGGQDYDAEFMGVGMDETNLYMAILTGQRPDNETANYSPGDIRITTMIDATGATREFGIEVGGGLNGVSDDGNLIQAGVNGTFYNIIQSTGHTNSATEDTNKVAGGLYLTPDDDDWVIAPSYTQPATTQLQLNLSGGDLLGMADYVFTRNSDTDLHGEDINSAIYTGMSNQHSVIELAIAGSLFGLVENEYISKIEWRPGCGNDELFVTMAPPTHPFSVVPEPTSLVIWGLLAMGAGICRARRRRRL